MKTSRNSDCIFIATASACAAFALSGVAAEPAAASTEYTKLHPVPATTAQVLANNSNNPIRNAPTGHVSNYDEAKVANYTLPDPLVMANGQPVKDAKMWFEQRRPEIVKLYETYIFGRVPDSAPKATFEVVDTDPAALNGTALRKSFVVKFGNGANDPKINVLMYLPAKAAGPSPVLLHMNFFGNPAVPAAAGAAADPARAGGPAAAPGGRGARGGGARGGGEAGPIADFLAHGYGYATFRYTEIQTDDATNIRGGIRAMALAPGKTDAAPDEWGTISAWAYGVSKVLDYLETDKDVDAKRVALIGHSRLGKTVLWAGAHDPRFALIFSSCGGEMGSALARRDFGESVDDMAKNFGWQFAGNFQKYAGHWNDMPVDSHMVIALNAPRPVFITGGTTDQWSDPHGEFLGEVAAGPVYSLVGKKDVGTKVLPELDTPLITGDLGYHYHTGGHTITASDWKAFLDFADKYFKAKP